MMYRIKFKKPDQKEKTRESESYPTITQTVDKLSDAVLTDDDFREFVTTAGLEIILEQEYGKTKHWIPIARLQPIKFYPQFRLLQVKP